MALLFAAAKPRREIRTIKTAPVHFLRLDQQSEHGPFQKHFVRTGSQSESHIIDVIVDLSPGMEHKDLIYEHPHGKIACLRASGPARRDRLAFFDPNLSGTSLFCVEILHHEGIAVALRLAGRCALQVLPWHP